jgi:xylulokinase
MKLNLELMEKSGMNINRFIATGGGTKHRAWTQLKADVLHKEIIVREIAEAGCYGASLLAQSALEQVPVVDLISRSTHHTTVFIPDPGRAETYERIFSTYKQLYPRLKSFW